jgi:O-antigen/teichoic acid export membrane protein
LTEPEKQTSFSNVNKGLGWVALENIFKVLEPLLLFACAGIYAGGEWGTFKFYESLVYLFFRVALIGFDRGIVWYFYNSKKDEYEKAVFHASNVILLFSGILIVFAVWGPAGWLMNGFSSKSPELAIEKSDLLLFLMTVPLLALRELFFQANAVLNNIKYRLLGNAILFPGIAYGGALVGHYFFNNKWGLILPYFCGVAISFLVALISVTILHNISWIKWRPSIVVSKKMRVYIFPLMGADILSAVAVRVDMFMLAGFAGVKSIEIYNIASMIGKSLAGIRKTFEAQLLGVFSSSGKAFLTDKVRNNYNYSIWVVMTILFFVLFAVIFFGKELLNFIHPQYISGYYTLIIACFFYWINVSADFTTLLVLGLGKTKIVPFAQILYFGCNILFNFIFIPSFDALGAIVALGMATSISGIVYYLYLQKNIETMILDLKYLQSIIVSILISSAWLVIANFNWDILSVRTICFLAGMISIVYYNKIQYAKFSH